MEFKVSCTCLPLLPRENFYSSLKSPKWVSGASHDFSNSKLFMNPQIKVVLSQAYIYHTSANPNPSYLSLINLINSHWPLHTSQPSRHVSNWTLPKVINLPMLFLTASTYIINENQSLICLINNKICIIYIHILTLATYQARDR